MSVTLTTPDRDTCADPDCDQEYPVPNAVAGSYCSQDCADRHDGRRLLRNIREDHRFCWSCWRARKEIERPTAYARRQLDTWRIDDAVVGFEYHTRHVDLGDHGLECECGAVDHDIDEWITRTEGPYHWLLKLIIEQMNDEGQHHHSFDIATFADTYWRTDDLELAVGRAIRT